MRAVHKILQARGYQILMVTEGGGENFGDMTMACLAVVQRTKGFVIAVCTHDYGQITKSKYSSYVELKYAYDQTMRVLPLKVDPKVYPPRPPLSDEYDKFGSAQVLVKMVLQNCVAFIDCCELDEQRVADEIAKAIDKLGRDCAALDSVSSEKVDGHGSRTQQAAASGYDAADAPIAAAAMESVVKDIFSLAKNGDAVGMRACLKSGANVNEATYTGSTPLWSAAQNGHAECVNILVAARANIDQAKDTGATPLFIAAQNGYKDIVEILIAGNATIDQANNEGVTPVFMASQKGYSEVVSALAAAKANLNQANTTHNNTPLAICAIEGHLDVAKELLKSRALVNQKVFQGMTVLEFAEKHGAANKEVMIELLKAHGAKR